jgi:glycosyltransferase involved in cell wall biosynthesis
LITINKNNLQGLVKTVESVKNQLYKDFEWFIIDGQSTDGSVEYLNQIEFPSLHKIIEADNGIYDAMNKGIDLIADKNLVLFLNSGDCLFNEYSLKVISDNKKQYDFVFGDFIIKRIINNKCIIRKIKQPDNLNFLWLFFKTLNHQSYLLKGSLLKKYKFNLQYKICADWVQLMEILRNENKLEWLKLDSVISIYDGDGMSFGSNYKLERKNYLTLNYSKVYLESVEEYSSVITKDIFPLVENISKSKWRWKLLEFLIIAMSFSKVFSLKK